MLHLLLHLFVLGGDLIQERGRWNEQAGRHNNPPTRLLHLQIYRASTPLALQIVCWDKLLGTSVKTFSRGININRYCNVRVAVRPEIYVQ